VDGGARRRAGSAVVAGNQHDLCARLGNARRDGSNACLGDKFYGNPRNDSILGPEDIEKKLGMHVLGTLPLEEAEDDGNRRAKKRKKKKAKQEEKNA
jgi:hypothetical protein